MESESSSAKWLFGCLIAGFLALTVCGGGVLLLVYWGFQSAGRIAEQVVPEVQQQLETIQFAADWRPPAADAGPERLFPPAVGAWQRTAQDDSAAIPELAIDRDGLHATYESAGSEVDVYTYRLPVAEKQPVFAEAAKAIDAAGYTTRTKADVDFGTLHTMTFSFSPPERYGRMWWAQDWLIVTIADKAAIDLEVFERQYLTAIENSATGEQPAEASPSVTDSPDD